MIADCLAFLLRAIILFYECVFVCVCNNGRAKCILMYLQSPTKSDRTFAEVHIVKLTKQHTVKVKEGAYAESNNISLWTLCAS